MLAMGFSSPVFAAEKEQAKKIAKKEKPKIEVCFVLDTTGSMGGLIAGAKEKIWSMANEMISAKPTPEIRIGLIGYRDKTDAYVTKVYQLSNDIDDIYGKLMAFQAQGRLWRPHALATGTRRDQPLQHSILSGSMAVLTATLLLAAC